MKTIILTILLILSSCSGNDDPNKCNKVYQVAYMNGQDTVLVWNDVISLDYYAKTIRFKISDSNRWVTIGYCNAIVTEECK